MRVVKYTIKCAICSEKQRPKILYKERITRVDERVYSARRTPDRQHFQVVKCQRCGLIFSNPIFPPKKINMLYKKSDLTYEDEASYLRKTYINYLKKILYGKKLDALKLLEIGCGNGFFLEEVMSLGIKNVYGIEPGVLSVKKATREMRNRIKVDILKPGLFKDNTFDIVCCFHTFDHVINPNRFLLLIKKLLKPGGVAFFVVHDTQGLSVKILGERSPIFDIEHIYLFNKMTLRTIFKKNGFDVMNIFELSNTYPLKYWIRLFPLPSGIKIPFLNFLTSIKLGVIPVRIKAGNIGIFAKK